MPISGGSYTLPTNNFAQPVPGNRVQAVDGAATLTDIETAIDSLVDGTGLADGAIGNAEFRDSAALSVVGRASNSTGDVADIAAGTDHHVLRRSGTTLGFGLIVDANVDASAAIAATKLANTPAGTISATTVQAAINELDTEKTTAAVVSAVSAMRNRIVNPAMQISQQNGTSTVDTTTGSAYTIDQWLVALSTTPGGTLRAQQVASATPGGSPFRLRHTAQASDGTISAGDRYSIRTIIEGQEIADALFGTASANPLILRFGVRSSLAGTFGVAVRNSAANRTWLGTITIASGEVNTDVVRTLTITGDTSGTWLTDTGIGLYLDITLAAGTTFQGSAGWQAGDYLTTSAQTNFMGTGSATFEIFDVGLYVDADGVGVIPTFDIPSAAATLSYCQRYYSTQVAHARFPAGAGSEIFENTIYWPEVMRTTPTATGPTGAVNLNIAGTSIFSLSVRGARLYIISTAAGDAYSIQGVFSANARF